MKTASAQAPSVWPQRTLALVAVGFGCLTIVAGGRVLGGADPGYVVWRPLLIFNTVMGVVYVMAGIVMWRGLRSGTRAAAAIVAINLIVLGFVGYLYATGSALAVDSVRAMAFRTVGWLAICLGMAWLARRLRRGGFAGSSP